MEQLEYKKNLPEVIPRLRDFIERRMIDRILAVFAIDTEGLRAFRSDPSVDSDYPDPRARARFWGAHLLAYRELLDDTAPSAYLSEFDQGICGGLCGGEVRFIRDPRTGWISSMVNPLLSSIDEFESLVFSSDGEWASRYRDQLDVFVRAARRRYGVSHLILIDSLNFLFECVGATATYLALIDRPEIVRAAIEFGYDLNSWIQDTFFDIVGSFAGGTFSNMVQWAPGRIVSESVDPFHMTSVDVFEEWGRAPIERMYARYDGGVLHIHGNGRHLIEAVATLAGLRAVYLGDDTGFPAAIEIAGELRRRFAEVPLVIGTDYATFRRKLGDKTLPGGVLYTVEAKGVTREEINETMPLVWAYRAG